MINKPVEDKHSHNLFYVGLDVHKDSIAPALAEEGRQGEVRRYGTISNDLHAIEKYFQMLRKAHGISNHQFRVVYEAGPCGFVIFRRLSQLGIPCVVIAPSLIPRKAGDKVKTDRRDAVKLARLHRAGELTPIHVPDEKDEAIRDLSRGRSDAVKDLRRCRQQLKAFLLRHGYKYSGKSSWNEAHFRSLREIVLPHAAHKALLEETLTAVTQSEERIQRLTELIHAHYEQWEASRFAKHSWALKAFRS